MCDFLSDEQESQLLQRFFDFIAEELVKSSIQAICQLESLKINLFHSELRLGIVVKNSKGVVSEPRSADNLIIDIDWLATQHQWVANKVKHHFQLLPTIEASSCSIVPIDPKTTSEFLNQNHPLGATSFESAWGLIFKHRLVALSTFAQPKTWLKNESSYRSGEWVRNATLSGLAILGGTEKLLNHYLKTQPQLNDIVTYLDPDWADENTLTRLGFQKEQTKALSNIFVSKTDFSRSHHHNPIPNAYPLQNKTTLKMRKKLA